MKVVQINATCGKGSTGTICLEISQLLSQNNIENYVFYAVGDSDSVTAVRYGSNKDIRISAARAHLTGNYGFTADRMTRRLIRLLENIRPDIVHLHNIHSHNCHLSLLFDYLRGKRIRIIWTFHDCWAFTGYCPHFMMTGCDKWRSSCGDCPQYRRFSTFFDRSHVLFEKKKTLLSGLDMTIVTPSDWLAGVVKQSFLKDYPVKVIHNGVDLNVFRPVSSDIRERRGIRSDRFMILGIAYDWSVRKGLDVFVRLAEKIDCERCQIVLAGVIDRGDLPDSIITLPHIGDPEELARLYTAADLFMNPTREDTFPTVNMEALACGTPVAAFDVGGCVETFSDETGIAVTVDDIQGMIDAVDTIRSSDRYTPEMCRSYAEKQFDKNNAYLSYLSCYLELTSKAGR